MNATRHKTIRRSFTLTELLVVIMVISVLASSLMFAMYNAVQQAKESRTRAQIAKLHELLATRWDGYRTRSIRYIIDTVNTPSVALQASARTYLARNPGALATVRLNLLRDLMRLEMPDRKLDVTDPPVSYPVNVGGQTAYVMIARPAVAREYFRRSSAATATWDDTHQDSECLYMIVSAMRDLASNGLDFLHEGEIGDTDGDGMPEILDAWGKPIAFIRWPAGFLVHPGKDLEWGVSGVDDDANTNTDDFSEAGWPSTDDIPNYSNLQRIQLDANDPSKVAGDVRDPFDPLRVDSRPSVSMFSTPSTSTSQYYFNYLMYPLVFSSGPDEALDIVRSDFDPNTTPPVNVAFNFYRSGSNPNGSVINDPYSVMPTSKRRLGEPFLDSDGYKDNITNHNLGD
jgi:prepilin-type N-terminal cleavage/methylation domain-containing protein